ncbi:hypothetical protein EMIHUDRAFT_234229 [Emiliania huxleyi CCMP1516]|uniref:ADP,ATP carrier protein n=2 Tax=Emiliania huxleyi TaxID=2903 RepID=A0A0D3JZT6_EMIH1|nr:hypothetical protein EMIHUDRAFT_234229 [Emiliania huxleyi CCMP1516]EOD29021.1 hypothetical protein EMIHUDRAFT_234229 [Emiliania huxleyi CCMP1516]|eukprot:XP_005781450.1 hypothetical protein EMIHUDRAFT_234229 [Emiliania huxleyi CCMP1516]
MALRSPRALACALLCLPASIAWHGSGVRPRLPSTSLASAPLALRPALHTRAAPARLAAAAAVPEPEPQRSGWRARLPPANELRKIVPLAIMFFCILFNYTILRDTKDVLVAPGSSAEAIPFLKTWVNLPGAGTLTQQHSLGALFYTVLSTFLAFFGAFGWLIYPLVSAGLLHPVRYVSKLHTSLPAGVDGWGVAPKLLMSAVVASGGVIMAAFRYLNVAVLKEADGSDGAPSPSGKLAPKKKKKPSMSIGERAT